MKLHSVVKLSCLAGLIMLSNQSLAQENTDNLTDNTTSVTAQTPEEDAAITRTIKSLISQSKLLSKYDISVVTEKGVVKYSGAVDSDTQADLLAEYAETVIGVSDIDMSNLKVKGSEHPLADSIITAKIKGLFIREKLFGEKNISAINTVVETKDGVVYLSGDVNDQEEIDNAIEIIKRNVPEIKRVEYSIRKHPSK